MQASSLFVLGLAAGALVVFGVRALSLDDAEAPARHASPAPTAPAPAPVAPSHADPVAPAHEGHDAPAGEPVVPVQEPVEADPDRAPENAICPVMGNEVDPEIYVDHEGRRIGFCCPGCDKLFLEDPEKYLEKVDAELRARSER
jgi:YHS domain-containing protein